MSEVTKNGINRNVDLKYVVRSDNGRSITTEIILNEDDTITIKFKVEIGVEVIALAINEERLDFESSSPLSVTEVTEKINS